MLASPEGCLDTVNEGLFESLGFGCAVLVGGVLLVDMDPDQDACIVAVPAPLQITNHLGSCKAVVFDSLGFGHAVLQNGVLPVDMDGVVAACISTCAEQCALCFAWSLEL